MKALRIILDILVVWAALIAVNYYFFSQHPGFHTISPHPYWLIVLFFALRSGVTAGLMTGLVAAALYMISGWYFLEPYLVEDTAFYVTPFLFVLAGIALGAYSRKHRTSMAAIKLEKSQLLSSNQTLQRELVAVQTVNAELERRVVTQMSSLTTLYEGARRLESMDVEEIYNTVLDFFRLTLEAEEVSIYLKEENGWRLHMQYGWHEGHAYPDFIELNEGIIGMAGAKQKIISIRDLVQTSPENDKASLPSGDAFLAGPIKRGEAGEVIAVYAIQKLPFIKLNSSTMIAFSFLLSWASRAIGRAIILKDLQIDAIRDIEYGTYTHHYFVTRAEQEFLLAQRSKLPIHVALARLNGWTQLPTKKRERVKLAVSQMLNTAVHKTDVVAGFDDPEIQFAILFIAVDRADVNRVRDKIVKSFNSLNLADMNLPAPVTLTMETITVSPAHRNVFEAIEQTKQRVYEAAQRTNPTPT